MTTLDKVGQRIKGGREERDQRRRRGGGELSHDYDGIQLFFFGKRDYFHITYLLSLSLSLSTKHMTAANF